MLMLDDDCRKFFPDFGHNLKDFQKLAIENVVENGNTLCIMPTGGGKSMIYQMSALELGGTTLVISPLISLIAEQVETISKFGYECLSFDSSTNSKKQI